MDHIAKPKITAQEMEPWAKHMRELAERSNIFCNISGMVTEADHQKWRREDLDPYFEVVLEAFVRSD